MCGFRRSRDVVWKHAVYVEGECGCLEGLVNSILNISAVRSGNADCQGFDELFCGGRCRHLQFILIIREILVLQWSSPLELSPL
ncbi:unnamed protein product [Allacma fusca]|uniref:Uncharacterized protein n=1 Tax=Allacma fusca TaxID=39272 RepID=A0A8J2L2E6_9HEXA|nr:unnamed protein product [Allacma fusca]